MEQIRILCYTDHFPISHNQYHWGLTQLKQFIELKVAPFAEVSISIMNRHFDYERNVPRHAATKLTVCRLSHYDELWVFGVLQGNTASNPENSLTRDEIKALSNWMTTGGVLITGDHSNAVDGSLCGSNVETFINLGAALGRDIPRAGEMRAWDGPPTSCLSKPLPLRDNHNTVEGEIPEELDADSGLQSDERPQTIYLKPPDKPHKLFWWYFDIVTQQVVPIRCFPDHGHEGKLRIPDKLADTWPPPVVVAQGRDKRFPDVPRFYDLVSIFDSPRVGRIVADSSFHHYINFNLLQIDGLMPDRSPKPSSDLDQIAQYYANLALWLAPKEKRNRIMWSLFFWAARHPAVLEERPNPPVIVGRTGLRLIENEIGVSNLYRLFNGSDENAESNYIAKLLSRVFSPQVEQRDVTKEEILGNIINQYHRFFDAEEILDPGWLPNDPTPPDVVGEGLRKAFENFPDGQAEVMLKFQLAAKALSGN